MKITAEERLKWWNEARFGMFIHWGLYAVPAGEWNGKKTEGIGEWIMRDLKIPISEYETFANGFNPVKFDAEAWANIALQAGMKYLVITAKHHDGFCMFDSPSNPYNITAQTPFGRDPIKELATACNKLGITMCFYYSQAQDWHAPGGSGHWEEETDDTPRAAEDFQNYLDDIVKPNIRELLSNYGPVGLIWFDTPVGITKEQSEDLRDFVHELQPECLVSGRVGHGVGDYGSLGDNQHPEGRVNGAWETPATLNDTWGFKTDDHNWKSFDYLLDLLVNCASKGVNYLLNVGPTAEGVIPQPSVERLKKLGHWLEINGEAIYGTTASPFPVDPEWGRITAKGNKLYLLVKEWPEDRVIKLVGLKNDIKNACLLGADKEHIEITCDGDTIVFLLPTDEPESLVSTVAVELDGIPDVEDIIIQNIGTSIRLPAYAAQINGSAVVSRGGQTERWTDTESSAQWIFRLKEPGEYEVAVVTFGRKKVPERFGNHHVKVSVAGQTVKGVAGVKDLDMGDDAPGPQKPRSVLGKVLLENGGEQELCVIAETIDSDADTGLQMFAVELTPVT